MMGSDGRWEIGISGRAICLVPPDQPIKGPKGNDPVLLFDMDCQVISEEVAGQQNPESARTVIATDRAAMSIPIRVSAFDEGRGEFVEDSHTTQVSAWGGWIVLKNWAYPMDVVRIVNLQ